MLLNIIKKHCGVEKFSSMHCPFFLLILFILPLVVCPLWGQAVQKKMLAPQDYSLWGEAVLQKMSPDAKWASFKIEYEQGPDTLFVRSILKKTSFAFPNGENGRFMQDIFICISNGELHILDLKTRKEKVIKDVKSYSCSDKQAQLIYLSGTENQTKFLEILSLETGKTKKISGAVDFLLSPAQDKLWYTILSAEGYGAALISFKNPDSISWLEKNSSEKFTSPVWDKHGMAVAFIKEHTNPVQNVLFYCDIVTNKVFQLSSQTNSLFFKTWSVIPDIQRKIIISDDRQSIYFAVKNNIHSIAEQKNPKAEVWSTEDKWIYPLEKLQKGILARSRSAVWNPSSGNTNVITSEQLPAVMMDGALHYAYLSNPKQYEPQFEYEGPRDIHVLNLKTFEKKIFLKKQLWDTEALNPSPAGKYFAYFKENNWWVYDPAADSHTNITAGLSVRFKGKKQELVPESVYGNPGWTTEDKEIILYDQYDIWSITPDGKNAERLTKGREKQITYRIIQPDSRVQKVIYNGPLLETFDLNKSLFLRAKGSDEKTGIFLWKKAGREKELVYRDAYLDQFQFSEKKQQIIFREQKFEQSPSLKFVDCSSKAEKTFFKSNPQQEKYFWGKSELIEFQNSKGDNLKGVLLYPAGYNPDKKYPMIVNIYEGKADELHIYQNPTLYNGGGFNTSLMTLNGYFVLLPDIKLEYQKPGISALDCVTSAVKKVIGKNLVNPKKIGLIGHSFGAYEALFIITQTPLFTASVAGGGISDLESFYHTIGRQGNPNIWRFEKEMWNMGGSPASYSEHYNANSPIQHVSKIEKPLLLWSGKNDQQVDVRQSQEMYLALRRLEKKSMMVLYPDEGHVLIKPENQKDITVRILEWFNYFLNDDYPSGWITESTQ
ncbi:fermentation-respiration switch protein FrsA (DUF1100 family) [Flavobacterium sp. 2755]|uniref:alpha/beta hydrolase family protein n=1 Tax=Flavobacterium sp. 2755 TaxID=2817765 RepID=UPI00286674E0|nr:prolyl oligopeptidase family serine peptidase [Flavobacterium sp. 2755]MDR6761903.1 fermentation-respiration switch protein FrsA (DUF1100 family) [Flavobacterium sp. 2755]